MCLFWRSPTAWSPESTSGDFIFNLPIAYSGKLEIGTRQLNNRRLHVPPDFLPNCQPGALSTRLRCNRMPRHRIRPPGRYTSPPVLSEDLSSEKTEEAFVNTSLRGMGRRIPRDSTLCCSDAPPNPSRIAWHVALINGYLHLPLALPQTVSKTLKPLTLLLFHHFLQTCVRSYFPLRKLSTFLDTLDHQLLLIFSRSSKGNYFPSSAGFSCIFTDLHHPITVWCIRCGLFFHFSFCVT